MEDKAVTVESIRIKVCADIDADTSYLEQPEFSVRAEQYRVGTFSYVGVRLEATIAIPYRDGSILQTITTPGVWGIEDDSGEDYFRDVASDEQEILRDMLNELGVHLPNGYALDYTDAPLVYS